MTKAELNTLVAEKILGWTRLEGEEAILKWSGGPIYYPQHFKCIWVSGPMARDLMACVECGSMPDFAGNIKLAWDVIQATIRKSELEDLPSEKRLPMIEVWGAVWILKQEYAAWAICTAALKAFGVEVEPESMGVFE